MKKSTVQKCMAVLLALALWQAAAMAVDLPMLLCAPTQVALRLTTIWREEGFFPTVLFSLLRIGGGFLLAVITGVVLGVLAGRFPLLETLLWPYVVTIRAVPVASFIIIALIWLSGRQLAVFIAFLMVFPVVYGNTLQGIRSADGALLEMAALYRVPWRRRLGYIYLPHMKPFLLSACSVGAGLAWKAGVAAEVIGVVSGSMGEKLYESKIYFETCDLLTWTLIIVLVSVGLEKLLVWALKRGFARWEAR